MKYPSLVYLLEYLYNNIKGSIILIYKFKYKIDHKHQVVKYKLVWITIYVSCKYHIYQFELVSYSMTIFMINWYVDKFIFILIGIKRFIVKSKTVIYIKSSKAKRN